MTTTLVVDGNKTCCHCKVEFPLEEFPLDRRGYRKSRCSACRNLQRREARQRNPERHKEVGRAYYARNKDKARDYNLRKLYGITAKQYDEMLAEQGGLCYLCEQPPTGKHNGAVLHTDHDHETGVVRRLICYGCNTGLGKFHDDPALLRRAAAYIEEFRAA